jgi:predicted nuclease of restriction endonuclease-like (RecB) superfamily
MPNDLNKHSASDYHQWLLDLKTRFRHVQLKAAVAVNTELLRFYWKLGADILAQQASQRWGSGFLEKLSQDLMQEFPDMKGFSVRNLKYIRQWHSFWTASPIGQQAVAQLTAIPWGHNLAILSKCSSHDQALCYMQQTQAHGWSRMVLTHQIESGLWQREGQPLTNFAQTLPAPQSELARQMLKDPYVFDFLSLTPEHTERELEKALIDHITHFLLELGAGFAYMGRQVALQVGERDAPTIGLLLCKSKDKLVAEYALSDMSKPLGLATYQLSHTLPAELQGQLPSIEALEAELKGVGNEE